MHQNFVFGLYFFFLYLTIYSDGLRVALNRLKPNNTRLSQNFFFQFVIQK